MHSRPTCIWFVSFTSDVIWHILIDVRAVLRCTTICPPPFRRKVEGHCFWFSVGRGACCVVRGAWRVARGAWFRVFSRYFVPLTPPTAFVRSFWNFTGVLRMVWRCACGFFRILKYFFYHFFRIFNLDIFLVLILQKCIWSRYLVPLTPPTVLADPFETL